MKHMVSKFLVLGLAVIVGIVMFGYVEPAVSAAASEQANYYQRDYIVVWGYVRCLDGSPIEDAQLSLTYACEGNDWSNDPVYTTSAENGYDCFMRSELNCTPDYGIVSAQYGDQHKRRIFNTNGVEKNFFFYCSNGFPLEGEEVVQGVEVTQLNQ